MKNNNFLVYLIFNVAVLLNVLGNFSFRKYEELETRSTKFITIDDLPSEFSEDALKTINEFIQKTHDLDYEIMMYFDYVTGKILKCVFGDLNSVKIEFIDGEFDGFHVASIHNHPLGVYSPPSDKNFGIFLRNFEDYELVSSFNHLWILEAKGVNPLMYVDLKESTGDILEYCQQYCDRIYSDSKKANAACDNIFGITLSNYINDKNIKNIQLTKREYTDVC